MTAIDRVRWGREVVRLRTEKNEKGRVKTWAQVSKITGLSERTCQRLEQMMRANGDPDAPADPMEWVRRRFDAITATMEMASETYEEAAPGSSVRVGALKAFNQASDDMFDLAGRVGFLPRQLGALSAEQELRQVFLEFRELLRDHGASAEMLDALIRLAERRVTGRRDTVEGRQLPAA